MTYASLFNEEAIAVAQEHHAKCGDEIGSTFPGIQCRQFRDKFASKELAIWLFSMEDKRRIVDEVVLHGRGTDQLPQGALPMIKTAVATCWEEGTKAYHNANKLLVHAPRRWSAEPPDSF